MIAQQLKDVEREAREILTGATELERKFTRLLALARSERPARRICTCGPCLRTWALRGLAIAATAVLLVTGLMFGRATVPHTYRSCTFDSGGTIASGEAATVTTGQTFVCLDGELIRVAFYGSAQ